MGYKRLSLKTEIEKIEKRKIRNLIGFNYVFFIIW